MSTGPIAFLIGDPDTAVSSLNVTVFSSNTNLVPANNIFLSGTGTNRTVTITPTASLGGSAVITLFVMDGEMDHAHVVHRVHWDRRADGLPLAGGQRHVGHGHAELVGLRHALAQLRQRPGDHRGASGTISLVPGMMANRVTFNSSATIQSNTLT